MTIKLKLLTSQLLLFVLICGFSSEVHAFPSISSLERISGSGSSDVNSGIVFVDFWASWCIPCKQANGEVARLKAKHPNVKFIGISIDVKKEKAANFLRKYPNNIANFHDPRGKNVARNVGYSTMPTSFLLKNGNIVRTYSGFRSGYSAKVSRDIKSLK